MHWYYSRGDHGVIGWMLMLLFWGLALWGVYALLARTTCGRGQKGNGETAEEIVRKRFARGEISKEEFDEKLKILKS